MRTKLRNQKETDRVIVLDFDGTLINSESIFWKLFKKRLKAETGQELKEEGLTKYVGMSNEEVSKELKADYNVEMDIMKEVKKDFLKKLETEGVDVNEKLVSYVKTENQDSYIVTNNVEKDVKYILCKLGLENLVKEVYSATDMCRSKEEILRDFIEVYGRENIEFHDDALSNVEVGEKLELETHEVKESEVEWVNYMFEEELDLEEDEPKLSKREERKQKKTEERNKEKVINGKELSETLKSEMKKEVIKLRLKNIHPTLAVIQVGKNEASSRYVANKEKYCNAVGVSTVKVWLEDTVSSEELLEEIRVLNEDDKVHGVLVQLPLPEGINEKKILESIKVEKDVDSFHPTNVGLNIQGDHYLKPCTPAGVIELLKRNEVELEGKTCVVVGRSNIVGKPLSNMLTNENCTVTLAHSKTKKLSSITSKADIVVVAMGRAKEITREHLKEGAVVIDVGIHVENGKLCGDVNYEDVINKVSKITPVPGGVGPMTVAMLVRNTIEIAKRESSCQE